MPVPAKRRSASKGRRGRSHLALEKTTLNKCPKCGKASRPHRACDFCGSYKGKEVLKKKTEKVKTKAKK